MTPTTTSGAADLPDAMHMAELLDNPINVVCQKTAAAVLRHQHSEFERLHALAAGQATAAQQSGAKLNYSVLYVYASQHGIDYNSLCVAVQEATAQPVAEPAKPIGYLNPKVLGPDGKIDAPGALTYSSRPCGGWTFPIYAAAPAQPAAQQGAAYAALPDERAAFEAQFPVPGGVHWDGTEYVVKDSHVLSYRCNRFEGQWEAWKARASHGQAPAETEFPVSAQADSVQEDAARYRWLAANCRSTSEHWGGRWSIVIEGPAPKSHNSEDDFDAAVDAARKQGEKQ